VGALAGVPRRRAPPARKRREGSAPDPGAAEIDSQRVQKDGEILVRERLLAARTEFERETRDHRIELDGLGASSTGGARARRQCR